MKLWDTAAWIKADAAAGGCRRGMSEAQSQEERKARMKSWRGAKKRHLYCGVGKTASRSCMLVSTKRHSFDISPWKGYRKNFIDFLRCGSPMTQNACFFLPGWGRAAVPGQGGVMYLSSVFMSSCCLYAAWTPTCTPPLSLSVQFKSQGIWRLSNSFDSGCCTDGDVQVSALTWGAIITTRQAISRGSPNHASPLRESYCFNMNNERLNLSSGCQRMARCDYFLGMPMTFIGSDSRRIGKKPLLGRTGWLTDEDGQRQNKSKREKTFETERKEEVARRALHTSMNSSSSTNHRMWNTVTWPWLMKQGNNKPPMHCHTKLE